MYNCRMAKKPARRLMAGGRSVRLDGYQRQPANTLEVLGIGRGRILLLVVPPNTKPDMAHTHDDDRGGAGRRFHCRRHARTRTPDEQLRYRPTNISSARADDIAKASPTSAQHCSLIELWWLSLARPVAATRRDRPGGVSSKKLETQPVRDVSAAAAADLTEHPLTPDTQVATASWDHLDTLIYFSSRRIPL